MEGQVTTHKDTKKREIPKVRMQPPEEYVKDPKGQVSKIVTLQALQSCKIEPMNSNGDQWNANSL